MKKRLSFTILLTILIGLLPSMMAYAQTYTVSPSGYTSVPTSNVTQGSRTFHGDLLQAKATVSGQTATFTLKKKDGSKFQNSGNIVVKNDSYDGTTVKSNIRYDGGIYNPTVDVDLDFTSGSKTYVIIIKSGDIFYYTNPITIKASSSSAAPTTPSSPSPTNGATSVATSGTLSWSCSANDGGSTLNYDLYMGTSTSNMTLYKSGQGKSCSYSGLSSGTKYYWKVVVYNGSGKSTQGDKWSFTTKEGTVSAPTTPSSPSPSNGATSVATSGTLSWSCSANDGGSTLNYDLYMGTSTSNMTLYKSGQGKSCSYSGLSSGTKYYWKVVVYNGSGKSTQGDKWSFTTKAGTTSTPIKPSSPTPASGKSNVSTSGTFKWSTSANDGGSTLNYDLYLDTSSSFANVSTPYKKGSGTSCSYSGLKSGTKYYWKVVVYNGSGKSTWSDVWSFTTTSSQTTLATPDPATFKATNITETGFTASWGAVSGADRYDISVWEVGEDNTRPAYESATSSTSIKVTGLDSNSSYKFQIRARNGNSSQNSDWSSNIPDAVTTKKLGTEPANISIYSVRGFDGTKLLVDGKTYTYSVFIINNGSSDWKGSFYLKEGDKDLQPWHNISLPSGGKAVQRLEFNYTPKGIGSKTLTLYYQTNTSGGGLPVKAGNAKNPMTIKVISDPSVYNGLKLTSTITYPSTLELGKRGTIVAQVQNTGEVNWEGTIFLTDNGVSIGSTDNLSSGQNKAIYATNWEPQTTGTHSIEVVYKSKDSSSKQRVDANGFANPVSVVVSNADVLGDASMVVVKHITSEVEPAEVTPGTIVCYYYRLLDENGKQLRNMTLRFKYMRNNQTKYIDSAPSDLEGYAILIIPTSGSEAIASRGETLNLECVQAITENGKSIPIKANVDSDKKLSLKIHQGNQFTQESGFENVEKIKVTITPGVSAKAGWNMLSEKAKAKAGLGFPIGLGLKWGDNGEVEDYSLDLGIKFNASIGSSNDDAKRTMSDFESFLPDINGKVGIGYKVSNTTSHPKDALIRFIMGWVDNYPESTDWKTDLAVKAMRQWYESRRDTRETKSWYYSVGADVSGNLFNKWPGFQKVKATLLPVLTLDELNLGANGNITIEPRKIKKDASTGKTLEGYSSALKIGGEFDFKGKIHNLLFLAQAKMQGYSLMDGYWREMLNDDFFFQSSSLNYSNDCSMKHEEMYDKGTSALEEVSQQWAISSSWELSTNNIQIGDILTDGWKPFDASLGYTSTLTNKVSSKGEWARFLNNQIVSNTEYSDWVMKVFPNLSYKTVIAPPYQIYNTWKEDFDVPLGSLARIAPNPNNYKLKEALKFERTVSSEFDASVNIKVYDWGWCQLYIDTDLNLELENKPNESYFSVPDRRTFDVVFRPNTSIKKVAGHAVKYAAQKIMESFEAEHSSILQAWEWIKQTYGLIVDGYGNLVKMVDDQIGDFAEDKIFYPFFYHWYMKDYYNANARRAMSRHPLLAEKEQVDICKFELGINKDEQNFDPGVKIEVPHYYPAGDLLGITDEGDTLFVVSEVMDIIATQGGDTLKTTQHGMFTLKGTHGVDDLTPFGFPEDTPLDVYYSEEGSKIWHYIGPVGATLLTDKLGAYMIGTSIKNDVIAPEILADYDEQTGVLHLKVNENVGLKINSLNIKLNGESKDYTTINESNFEVYLTEEDMRYMLAFTVSIYDLAGNAGTLYQTFQLDKPEKINFATEPDTDISQLDNTIYVEPVSGTPGSDVTISVKMKNSVEAEGFQFDLELPQGVSVVKDADGYAEAYLSTERTTARKTNTFDTAFLENGSLRVIAGSTNGSTISGDDGEVASIKLKIDKSVTAGSYPIVLRNIAISDANAVSHDVAYVKSTLTIDGGLMGDANHDGVVNVFDVTAMVNYILGSSTGTFMFEAADVNADGIVNVFDVTKVVNIILGVDAGAKRRVAMREAGKGIMSAVIDGNEMYLVVDDAPQYVAMQFDVVMPEGTSVGDVELNNAAGHMLSYRQIDENHYRVIAYSLQNAGFKPTEKALVCMKQATGANIENAMLVTTDGRCINMNVKDEATGIDPVDVRNERKAIYNLSGQYMGTDVNSLPKGIYIRNKQKVYIK